jgi:Lecithin retinol acyltransferase
MSGKFQSGDHLHVFRRVAGLPAGYYHHGIYISNDRVIQFGGGVPLLHKHSIGLTR